MTPRARLLRFLRRMPCDVAYTTAGFARFTGLPGGKVRTILEVLRGEGLVLVTYPSLPPAFYKPLRAECKPGKRCKRPACRLHRESKRLAALADKVAAS